MGASTAQTRMVSWWPTACDARGRASSRWAAHAAVPSVRGFYGAQMRQAHRNEAVAADRLGCLVHCPDQRCQLERLWQHRHVEALQEFPAVRVDTLAPGGEQHIAMAGEQPTSLIDRRYVENIQPPKWGQSVIHKRHHWILTEAQSGQCRNATGCFRDHVPCLLP